MNADGEKEGKQKLSQELDKFRLASKTKASEGRKEFFPVLSGDLKDRLYSMREDPKLFHKETSVHEGDTKLLSPQVSEAGKVDDKKENDEKERDEENEENENREPNTETHDMDAPVSDPTEETQPVFHFDLATYRNL